jgi:hypothetical protein
MKPQWPKKPEKEQFEISKFISAYADLPNGRSFVVYSKMVVVHTEGGVNIRLISARKGSKKERKQYEENAKRSGHA